MRSKQPFFSSRWVTRVPFLLLVGLLACNRSQTEKPPPLPVPPGPAQPALSPASAALPARFVSFTSVIDRRIKDASERAQPIIDSLARLQPDYEAARYCDLGETLHELLGADTEQVDQIRPYVFNQWSPWLTNYCLLHAFLADSASVLPTISAGERPSGYPRPVHLPTRSARKLYLVGEQQVALLEFRPDGAFRGMMLGHANPFGGVEHLLFTQADAELLVLTTVHGNMGAGRCASGESATYLQVYDLLHDQWLLNERVGRSEIMLGGCEDENGAEVGSQELDVTRSYRVRDQGRTLHLGGYTVSGDATDTDTTSTELAEGTYRLRQGRYQRVGN